MSSSAWICMVLSAFIAASCSPSSQNSTAGPADIAVGNLDVSATLLDADGLADSDTQGIDIETDINPPGTSDVYGSYDGAADTVADQGDQPDALLDLYVNPYKPATGAAPVIVVHPWPPPCANPHTVGDAEGNPTTGYPNQNYWGPPDYWCGNLTAANDVPACTPDATMCCDFGGSCIPVGWLYCTGCFPDDCDGCKPADPACPPQCTAQPSPYDAAGNAIWHSDACKAFLSILEGDRKCAFCGSDVYCQDVQP